MPFVVDVTPGQRIVEFGWSRLTHAEWTGQWLFGRDVDAEPGGAVQHSRAGKGSIHRPHRLTS